RLRAVRRGGRGHRQPREPLPRARPPDRVVAVHRTDAGLPVFTGDPADLAPEERASLEGAAAWGATEGAYAAMHRTKPQTAAFGLTDSPAGLAAWIVEKLRAWSDCNGDVERCFTKD